MCCLVAMVTLSEHCVFSCSYILLLALAVRRYEHRVSVVVGNNEKMREQRETGSRV